MWTDVAKILILDVCEGLGNYSGLDTYLVIKKFQCNDREGCRYWLQYFPRK